MLAKLGWKIVGGAASGFAAKGAERMLRHLWTVGTGDEPPGSPEPHHHLVPTLAWTALAATGLTAARLLAQREAARVWDFTFGSPPPGMELAVATRH